MKEIEIADGHTAILTSPAFDSEEKRLIVTNSGGKLYFREEAGAIRGIAMGSTATERRAVAKRLFRSPDGRVEIPEGFDIAIDPLEDARVFPPEARYHACVYVDAYDDGFRLVGGDGIVGAIVGEDLDEKHET